MCGIFAILNRDGTGVDQQLLSNGTNALRHRGPDGEGYWVENNIGVGHRRLSIIDLSEAGSQPMLHEDLIIAYNGEIYNFKEIRDELEDEGCTFRSLSDTEVVLQAYKFWGPGFEEKLNGMWAFIIYDQNHKKTYISRDRYGMKPLYLFTVKKGLYISSEIKAFKVLPEWDGKLNQTMVSDFLIEGLLHHKEESLFKNVKMFPAGSYAIYDEKGKRETRSKYFSLSSKRVSKPIEAETVKSSFKESVLNHLVSDVEVATSLSGGIDSSAITCLAYEKDQKGKTFSYIPAQEEISEKKYIDEVVSAKKLDSFAISPDFEDHIKHLKEVIVANDAPALNINLVSHYLLYKNVANNNIKVLISGQGADELLCGYNTYYLPFLKDLVKSKNLKFIPEAYHLVIKFPRIVSKIFSKLKPSPNYKRFLVNTESSKVFKDSSFDIYYRFMIQEGILPGLLQFEDRNSMAHGVEGRFPFLDKNFGDLCHSIPVNQKITKGIRKSIFRRAMRGIVPDKILDRRDKMGYVAPQDKWMVEHQEYFLQAIKVGMKNFPGYLHSGFHEFAENCLENGENQNFRFIWRVYSFFIFLEIINTSK